jgi:DNA modification methylase
MKKSASPRVDVLPIEQGATPDLNNVNKHTQRGGKLLGNSLRKRGAFRSIASAGKGVEVPVVGAGNFTLENAVDAGFTEIVNVHVSGNQLVNVVRDDIAPGSPEFYALAIEDNEVGRQSYNPDVDILASLAAGDSAILAALRQEDKIFDSMVGEMGLKEESQDAEPQIDRAAELLEKWKVKTGDLWQIGEHRLICGDCTDAAVVARVMDGERADCVFTSFPYAVGVDYGETYEDNIENLRRLIKVLSVSFLDVVIDGGFAVLNFGDIASGRNITETYEPCEYPMALEYYPMFRSAGWLLWSRRIWCKPNARVNSLWCIGSNRAATDWEHIWTFRKTGEAIIKRVDGKYSSALGWIDTSLMHGVDEGKEIHGAGMALGIVDWMLTTHSRHDSIIHEPFTGTGTTLVACENLHRRGRGIEISPAYCAVTLERMATAFPHLEIKRLQ